MKELDMRLIVESRCEGGEWEEAGTYMLSGWQCAQIVMVLSGVDLGAFAAMPIAAQERALQNIIDNRPPNAAMI